MSLKLLSIPPLTKCDFSRF